MNNKGISNLWVEFIIIKEDGVSVCGLCENSGHIQTKAGSAFCICPNGRVL